MRSLALDAAALVLREAAPVVAIERLHALPCASTACWDEVIVECWLASQNRRWDIMGAVSRSQDFERLPESLRTSPLARLWAAGDVPSSHLWFEWDVHRLDSSSPEPLCSICVADSVVGEAAERRVPTDAESLRSLRSQVLSACGRPGAEPVVETLVRTLGRDGELLHIADLSPRGGALRLAFFVRADRLIPWLDRCGWRGPIDPLPGVLYSACPPFERTAVQLEIGDTDELTPYVGIESREWTTAIPGPQVRLWRKSFDALGIASDHEVERWAAWAGREHLVSDSRCVGFTFFKTAFDGARWVVKAYLGSRPIG